jgi:type IV pilus assembly protein PilE
MIAVAIVGILAAIAYPAYTSHTTKSNRAAAQAHLMEIAQKQVEYLVDNRAYASDLSTLGLTTPAKVASLYTITISATSGPPPTFTATATPISGTAQAGDDTLTINSAGVKTPSDKW